jgi:hypothetical protein
VLIPKGCLAKTLSALRRLRCPPLRRHRLLKLLCRCAAIASSNRWPARRLRVGRRVRSRILWAPRGLIRPPRMAASLVGRFPDAPPWTPIGPLDLPPAYEAEPAATVVACPVEGATLRNRERWEACGTIYSTANEIRTRQPEGGYRARIGKSGTACYHFATQLIYDPLAHPRGRNDVVPNVQIQRGRLHHRGL